MMINKLGVWFLTKIMRILGCKTKQLTSLATLIALVMSCLVLKDWKPKVKKVRENKTKKHKMKIKLKKDYKKNQIKFSQEKANNFNTTKKQKNAKLAEMHILGLIFAKSTQ